jgi:hypothetical protein
MEVVHFIYNEKEIDFLPSGDVNVMVNATQMAKIFGKRIDFFLKTDHTKAFIKVLEFTPFGGNSEPLTRDQIIQTKGQSGTFFNRILALKFAAWLDTEFELWVFTTIDKIILGYYKEQKEATTAKLMAENELKEKKEELLKKYPEFVDFLNIEGKISDAERRRLKAIRASVAQLRFDLFADAKK